MSTQTRLLALAATLLSASAAHAQIPFTIFENASNAPASGFNITVAISQNTAGTIDFTFANASTAPNSIASIDDIYFESTPFSQARLGGGAIQGSTGTVNFSTGANPGSVPGGNTLTFGPNLYSAGRSGNANNGVGPGDTLTIRFNLLTGTFTDFFNAWKDQASLFRIAAHVQRLGDGGAFSVGAVAIPSPAGAVVLAGVGGLLMIRRRDRA